MERGVSGDDGYERGMKVRREVLGDEYVDRVTAEANEHTRAFQEFNTRYAWGEIWSRPGLERTTRSVIALAALVALGRYDELELHIRGAKRNGLTNEQLAEVLLQTAVYCGIPAARGAFEVFRRLLDEGL